MAIGIGIMESNMEDAVMYIVGALLAISMGILSIGHYLWIQKNESTISVENLEKSRRTQESQELEDTTKVA